MDPNPMLLVPLPDGRWIALGALDLAGALARGAELMPSAASKVKAETGPDELLTAEQMEARSGIKAGWYLQQARLNKIPYVRAGKYVRFSFEAVKSHQARLPDTGITNPGIPAKSLIGNRR